MSPILLFGVVNVLMFAYYCFLILVYIHVCLLLVLDPYIYPCLLDSYGCSFQVVDWLCLDFRLKLKGLYMYVTGFYSYSIFALLFWETRRSDFWVSMGHHIATVILTVMSYIFRYLTRFRSATSFLVALKKNCFNQSTLG